MDRSLSRRTAVSFALLLGLTLAALPATVRARTLPATPAAPADTLTGQVRGPDGEPVPDAEVYVVEMDRSVLTDTTGTFRLAHTEQSTYTLRVSAPGYASWVGKVSPSNGHTVNVSLKSEAFELEPLTVSATRSAIASKDSPLPAVSFGRAELDKGYSVSLAHALEEVSGVRTLSTGDEIGKPVIRGLSGPRVLVLVNGMRLEDYSWSQEDAPAVDAQMADRVEVVKGPASVLYGSDALGGIVNVAPAPLPDAWGGEPVVRSSATLYGAWNNREGGLGLMNEGANGSWSWRARGIGRYSGSIHTPSGELDNTGFFSINGDGALSYRSGWGSLTTRFAHYGGEFKLLEANGPPAGAGQAQDQGPERKLADDRVQVLGRFPTSHMLLEVKGQFQRHWLEEVGDVPGHPGVEAPEFELTLYTSTAEFLAHHTLGSRVHGTAGVSLMHQVSASGAGRTIVPDATTQSGGLFDLEQIDLGRLSLLAGARIDNRSIGATLHDTLRYTQASWSAGGVMHLTDILSLSANVGAGWRAPSLFELFANGPQIGDARYEIGDASLHPEQNIDVDGGIHLDASKVRAQLTMYHNAVRDYIYLLPTSDTLQGFQVFRHKQGDATLTGGEASIHVEVTPVWSLESHGDWVRGELNATGGPLPLMPPPRVAVGAEWHQGDRYLFGEVEHVTKQTRLTEFDTPTNAYTLLNLGAGFNANLVGRDMAFDLQVHNAANTSYRDFLSRYKRFALNPGRNIVLRIQTGL
jgi:outer membrane receptor protein involved in Fe transport